MRATLGTRAGQSRGPLAWLVIASVLALSLLGGGTALANNPDWTVGHGTDSFAANQPASGASSSAVSAGKRVGFFEWLRNDGTSNIAQLYLTASTTPATTVFGATWAIKTSAGDVVRSGVCPTATPLLCSFGSLAPSQTVYSTVAFTTSAATKDGTPLDVTFSWNANGSTTKDKNKTSRGDVQPLSDSVLLTTNGDAAGDFNFNQSSITVANDQKVTGKNPQATSVTLDATQVGAAVDDNPTLTTPCSPSLIAGFPTWFSCSLLTSLTSVVEVGNGKDFVSPTNNPRIKVVVTFSQAPSQLSGANPFAYHYWVDVAGVPHAELITTTCTLADGSPTDTAPCLIVGNKQVTVWLRHNGPMKF